MQWADAACVEALRKLDTAKMSPEAIAFRDRSSSFFANPHLTLVGKPLTSYFIMQESKDCPFQSEMDVREVFGLKKAAAHPPGPALQKSPSARPEMLTSAKPPAPPQTRDVPRPVISLRHLLANNTAPRP